MLVVKVELHPHGDSKRAEVLTTAIIANDDDHPRRPKYGNYSVYQLDRNGRRCKKAEVKNHPRLAVSVWKLIAKALVALGH